MHIDMDRIRTDILSLEPNTQTAYVSYIRRLGLEDGDNFQIHEVVNKIKRIPNVNSRRTISIAMRSMFPELKPYLKIENSLPKHYNLSGVNEILQGCPHTTRYIPMRLMAFGGLRVGEAVAASGQDLTGNTLNVSKSRNSQGVIKATKGNAGHVVLPSWLADEMRDWQGTEQLPNSYYKWLRRNTGLTPHSLRHFYATQLIKSGVNPEIVRRQLRHANLSTTLQTYAQIEASDIEHTIEEVFNG